MNILHLPLEFHRWHSAKKFSYPVGVGMIEGIENNDIHHYTIPAMYSGGFWLDFIKEMVGAIKFDQVWLEVVHSTIPKSILEWLATVAPIRVGFIVESLTINPNEFKDNQAGTQRRVDNLNLKLPYLTHVLVCDGMDLNKFKIPSMLFATSIPKRLVQAPNTMRGPALFYGTAYGERSLWLDKLAGYVLINPPSAETYSELPYRFEQLFKGSYPISEYPKFFSQWYSARKGVYTIWINYLHNLPCCAMLNLPHRTQVTSGRIIEGMAAGKPVLSPFLHNEMDGRFVNRKNILYYENETDLIELIKELQRNLDFGNYIAEEARKNVLENYTTEVLVKRILELTK